VEGLEMKTTLNIWRYGRSGAVAGIISVFAFAIIHHLFISNIWFSLIIMLPAGVLCGACVGWSYGLIFEPSSIGSWLRYNMVYVLMFVLLGGVSVLVFEPVTTIMALVVANEPPDELIGQAMPMTIIFTLATATLLSWRYGRSWLHYGVILLTCILLVLFLGLNVSVIGLVYIPGNSLYLIAEMFGLILAINLVYVATFMVLERKSLVGGGEVSGRRIPNPAAE
jgi:hypothetical protein